MINILKVFIELFSGKIIRTFNKKTLLLTGMLRRWTKSVIEA